MLGEAAGVWIGELIYVSALIVNILRGEGEAGQFQNMFFSFLYLNVCVYDGYWLLVIN